jgi:HlyD family secretion protein
MQNTRRPVLAGVLGGAAKIPRIPDALRKPVIAAALLALIAAFGVWRWTVRGNGAGSFRTTPLKRGELVTSIGATGTIEPIEVVDVGAQVAGQITSFGQDREGKAVDYGSMIDEGTVLARIDDSVYAADLAVAKAQFERDKAGESSAAANLEQMKAKLVQAESAWIRAQDLKRSQVLTAPLYDSAKADYEVCQANITVGEAAIAQARAARLQAQAAVEKQQRNLDFCTIRSPVAGVIIDRRVNIGQTVVSSLNTPSLFLIARDLTRMQIWASVNEADIGRIVPGGPATFTCDAFPGRTFKGSVGKVRLNAAMTQNVVMYTVEVDTDNPDRTLLPYLTANVRFLVHTESNTLMVPNAALHWAPTALAQIAPGFRSSNLLDSTAEPPTDVKPAKGGQDPKARQGVLWRKAGKFVQPLEVSVGVSDGTNTAVFSDALREGDEIVVGSLSETSPAGMKNPFLPQPFKR